MSHAPFEFWWVKIKPYKNINGEEEPGGWEPMMRYGNRKWFRAGVIYRFKPEDIERVGPKLEFDESNYPEASSQTAND